jgi:serine O-acetyltransferase
MTLSEYKRFVHTDLYRLRGRGGSGELLWALTRHEGFKFCFWMRTCAYARPHPLLRFLLYPVARAFTTRYRYRFGISIDFTTRIGEGFYIGHFGGIVVNGLSAIGRNCNISHGVTIGQVNRGNRAGIPTIGDNVYIGPGAKILGGIRVGDGAAIGANCVVIRDVPENGVVVGIPGRVISHTGSDGYVNHTDY